MRKKIRIDELLVARGLSPSLEQARALLMAGSVWIGDVRIDKAGSLVAWEAPIDLRVKRHPFVSRGGMKLQGALEHFDIDVTDAVALDIGASTGGFTDCLLQRGARLVYALDVGKGLLDWRLRNDTRVVLKEGYNIRHCNEGMFMLPIDIATIDVSFISLKLVIPVAARFVRKGGTLIALIKPQFEARRAQVAAGGVVRDVAVHQEVVKRISDFCAAQEGMKVCGVGEAHPAGRDGNKEFFIHMEKADG